MRVAKIDGQYKINPKTTELDRATIDLIVAATEKDICMVEGEMSECSEAEVVEAIKIAHEAIKVQCQAQKELTIKVGKTEKREYNHETHDEELRAAVRAYCYDKIYEVAQRQNPNKKGRSDGFKAVRDEYLATFPTDSGVNVGLVKTYFHDLEWEASRRLVLDERTRLDGRKLDQIRAISGRSRLSARSPRIGVVYAGGNPVADNRYALGYQNRRADCRSDDVPGLQ